MCKGNPGILAKIVDHFGIDETGSNFPTKIFDPHCYNNEDYEDSIRKRYSNPNMSYPSRRTQNAVISEITKQAAAQEAVAKISHNSTVDNEVARKRKSKWGETVFNSDEFKK